MWFDAWTDIGRIVAVGAAAYLTLVLVLRFSGKRTLSKLNAFDFVVTVALGSTLATIVLNSAVSWAEGAVALAMLTVLQLLVASTTSRLPFTRKVLTAEPTYLVRDGVLDEAAMRNERIAAAEVRQALRSSGAGSLQEVAAVILETDGTLSVITRSRAGDSWALEDVRDSTRPDSGTGSSPSP
jgi:uncharacterized membrane protein YcaP (DUF421 family)